MKKLFLGLSIVSSTLFFSQSFGLKGGANLSSISSGGEGFDDTKSKIGFNAGFFANIPVGNVIRIQPELLYSQMGTESNYKTILGNYTSSKNLDYLTAPIMVQFSLLDKIYIEAGPEFGYLISAKDKITNTNNGAVSESENYRDQLNPFNFGVGLGAGVNITNNFGISTRYTAGVSDITKKNSNSNNVNRNNNFQLGVNLRF